LSITWKAEEMGRVSAVAKPTVTHVRGHEVVPETVLRRRKTQAEVKEKREEILAAQRQKRSNKPAAGNLFKKAAAFVKDYRQKFASGTRLARESKKFRKQSDVDVESKLLLVIRHKAGKNLDDKTKKILHVLKLYDMHSASFVKATTATTKMLHLASPGIVYGEPSLKTVRDLIQKRGFARIKKKRVALTNNQVCSAPYNAPRS
jgi:60S ribosomal protein uL30